MCIKCIKYLYLCIQVYTAYIETLFITYLGLAIALVIHNSYIISLFIRIEISRT